MVSQCLNEGCKLLDTSKFSIVSQGGNIHLIETEATGSADLDLHFDSDALVFHEADKHVFQYLNDNCKRCCDNILFAFDQGVENECTLHVMEFTKKVDYFKLKDKIRPQLKMGIMNAKALAGFLSLDIKQIKTYVVYREFSAGGCYSVVKRAVNSSSRSVLDWEDNKSTFEMPWGTRSYPNVKVQLDENGVGMLTL